ncbi:MAG: hypothetical protein JRN52_07420 [Nitrososphaerota archaeon]|nr:hypothetical protein [Nitrososphaerota archaeon]
MVNTLVEPKRTVISSVRTRLLSLGFSEEVEYDSINIEPVLIYNKAEQVVLLKHKWEVVALVPLRTANANYESVKDLVSLDEEGSRWLRFDLPSSQDTLFSMLAAD